MVGFGKRQRMGNPIFSVVIPVYNSEESINELYNRLDKVFGKIRKSWELILINDCSKDKSWDRIKELASKHKRVTAINLRKNFGQHSTQMCGLNFVKGKYAITMDDDLQHPPEEIPKLIKTISSHDYSVVYGQYKQKRHGLFRDISSHLVNKILAKITGTGYKVTHFRIIKKDIVDEIINYKGYNINIDVLIKDSVSPKYVGHCRVEHHERTVGKSNYSFKKLFFYALDMIFNFTIWPLRFATLLGFFLFIASALLALFYIIYYLTVGIKVNGWTSLILAITFFSGIILFMLGVMGEYVGRIFLNISQKPQFTIKEIKN